MSKPKACILRADGTNCDQELFYAFEKFGAAPEYVQVNQLRSKGKKLNSFQILAIPGGFAYGDDIASGKILAVELISFLKDQLQEFIYKKGLIIGVCNGFQVLVRTGLLPFGNFGKMDATLSQNTSGHFECRWVKVKIEPSRCVFLTPKYLKPGLSTNSKPGLDKLRSFDIAVNHGEGRFFASPDVVKRIENDNLVVFRYVDENCKPAQQYPQNPNGSLNAIAGITNPTGRILALMPHPEKIVDETQHPNWRRNNVKALGGIIFEGMVKYAKQN